MYGSKQLRATAITGAWTLGALFGLVAYMPFAAAQAPQPIPIGPFDFEPSLSIEYIEDDNLYQSSDAEVATGITIISPTFELIFDNGVSGVSLSYSIENATFTDVPEEDYTDQRVDFSAGTVFGGIHRIETSASYVESHDRQSGGGVEAADSPDDNSSNNSLDEFEDVDYDIGYTLGTEESTFNFSLGAGVFERTYTNNRFDNSTSPPTAVTALSDRVETRFITGLTWNVSPDLSAGISYTQTDIEYEIFQPTRDGDEKVIALEFDWDALDSLNFSLSLGQTQRKTDGGFDSDGMFSPSTENESDYWDLQVEWAFLSYSTLTFFSASYVDEAEATGAGFSVREEAGFSWEHDWSDRFETEFSYADTSINYENDNLGREDTNEAISLRAGYQFRRWANISVFYQQFTRGSTTTEEYDQSIYGITGLFTL